MEAPRIPVSVIVPAYNAASTLPRALDSVVAQTVRPQEVIIVDDSSSDATADVAAQWCAAHPELSACVLRLSQNGGAGTARNAGWAQATGEFIAFLDADDAWHPRKLSVQYGWMLRHPDVALSGHRCGVIGESAQAIEMRDDAEPPVTMRDLGDFLMANRISTPSVMVRRDVRPRFVEGKRYSEDYLLWMEIVHAHGPAAIIQWPLATLFKARYGEAGLSADHRKMRLGEADTFAHLRRQGIIPPLTWCLIAGLGWLKFCKRRVSHGVLAGKSR